MIMGSNILIQRPNYCDILGMSSENISAKKIVLVFKSITDISKFKHECECSDFYIDRDQLTLVGTFSDEQLQLATNKYSALCKMDH